MSRAETKTNTNTKAYLAWFSVALFFLYQYILRVSPGVMIDELRQSFHLTAQEFGALGAYYLYAYSLLQIPLGLLIDRIGVRRTILGSLILCMLSTVLMAMASQFWIVLLSRIIVGAGSATAFMGALKIAADYLPDGKRGLLMGATLSMGTMGALTAGKPLVYCLTFLSWQATMLLTLVIGFFIFLIAFIFLPKHITRDISKEIISAHMSHKILQVLRNKTVMLYAILAIGVYTPLAALADLWGTAFLKQKFSLDRADAAQISMMLYVGLAMGSIILPWICERYNILNRGIQICGFILLVTFAILLYGPPLSNTTLVFLLITIGFMCGAEMMCFTGTVLFTTTENSGITIGVVNTMNMLGGAILQYIIGFGLDWQWQGTYDQYHLRTYSTEEFIYALTSLLIIIAICCVMSLGLRSKRSFSS